MDADGLQDSSLSRPCCCRPVCGDDTSGAGVVLAWWMYSKPSTLPEKMALALGPFARLSRNRFYWDDLYFLLIVHPVTAISRWGTWFDEHVWARGRQAARRGFARFAGE